MTSTVRVLVHTVFELRLFNAPRRATSIRSPLLSAPYTTQHKRPRGAAVRLVETRVLSSRRSRRPRRAVSLLYECCNVTYCTLVFCSAALPTRLCTENLVYSTVNPDATRRDAFSSRLSHLLANLRTHSFFVKASHHIASTARRSKCIATLRDA